MTGPAHTYDEALAALRTRAKLAAESGGMAPFDTFPVESWELVAWLEIIEKLLGRIEKAEGGRSA